MDAASGERGARKGAAALVPASALKKPRMAGIRQNRGEWIFRQRFVHGGRVFNRGTLAIMRVYASINSRIEQMGSRSSSTQLEWQQITDVYAYKKDCFSMDQIRILLGDEVQRKWIEVTEHDEGYRELIAELPHHLPGCLSEEEWWRDVAMPPFETQWTQLYHRE